MYDDGNDVTSPEAETFESVLHTRLSRRGLITGGTAAAGAAVAVSVIGAGSAGAATAAEAADVAEDTAGFYPRPFGNRLQFDPMEPVDRTDDAFRTAEHLDHQVILRWGDPIFSSAPEFDVANQTGESQAQQVGFNHDFQAFMPLPRPRRIGDEQSSTRGMFWINHEYTSGSNMFPDYDVNTEDMDQLKAWVDVELEAHGATIAEINRGEKNWWVRKAAPRNRRISANTEMRFDGPAADDARLDGGVVGMLNNCGGGVTPWGTVLTAEENFNQYFANAAEAGDELAGLYDRYGVPTGASPRRWEAVYPERFDLSVNPGAALKYGYIVEVDPYDPDFVPVKHTALGRFKHEAATVVLSKNWRAVVYSGDDQRFDYLYKYVSKNKYNPSDREGALRLLSEGTLMVAKFNADGTGRWIPLTPETPGLEAWSQADICINTRQAADIVGATRMDRPEDVQASPRTGYVYMACTNNSRRTELATDPGEAAVNPRWEGGNPWGHIVEIREARDDASAKAFRWETLMLCGDPAVDGATVLTDPQMASSATDLFFGGWNGEVSPVSAPDNLGFDPNGNLVISTDGQPGGIGYNDAIHLAKLDGPERGRPMQAASVPAGAEATGPIFTPDGKNLFVAVQHPGERGAKTVPGDPTTNDQSSWPDGPGSVPRPATAVIMNKNRNLPVVY